MQAAEMNQCEVAECLLDYGVDPFATECNGRTAVHFAAREVGPSDRVFELRLIFTGKAGGVAVGQGYIAFKAARIGVDPLATVCNGSTAVHFTAREVLSFSLEVLSFKALVCVWGPGSGH